jgi:S1-C subfamily serine protease
VFSFPVSVSVKVWAIPMALASLSTPLSSRNLPSVNFVNLAHQLTWAVHVPSRQAERIESLQARMSVPEIAQKITVRILTDTDMGSGVIIERRGHRYTILTNHHVVQKSEQNHYEILTPDGRTHLGRWLRSQQFGNLDLALVEFSSNQSYQVAEIGNSNTLSVGDAVYAAGFPNWHFEPGLAEDTRDWGLKAYRLTQGRLEMLSRKPLESGYQIGYSNNIETGMSGGPILNQNGELIGVNGRQKYPLIGIDAFMFSDGSRPSEVEAERMVPLSWGIPIANLQPGNNSFEAEIDLNPAEDRAEDGAFEVEEPENPFGDLFEPVFW